MNGNSMTALSKELRAFLDVFKAHVSGGADPGVFWQENQIPSLALLEFELPLQIALAKKNFDKEVVVNPFWNIVSVVIEGRHQTFKNPAIFQIHDQYYAQDPTTQLLGWKGERGFRILDVTERLDADDLLSPAIKAAIVAARRAVKDSKTRVCIFDADAILKGSDFHQRFVKVSLN
ncbi:unnamed protein product [Sphagnum balticum]